MDFQKNYLRIYTVAIAVFAHCLIGSVDSLLCYKCLSLDCPSNEPTCENVRDFIITELQPYYDTLANYLPPCPNVNNTFDWQLLTLENSRCPETRSGDATCSLGRLQIISLKGQDAQKENGIVSHATILGCAATKLLNNIKKSTERNQCNMMYVNGTRDSISHHMSVEHCSQTAELCVSDYCVRPAESVVKSFKKQTEDRKFEYGIVIGIIAVILVVFAALFFASMCRSPINRASNLPSSGEVDSVEILNNALSPEIPNNGILNRDADTLQSTSSRMHMLPRKVLPTTFTTNSSKSTDIY